MTNLRFVHAADLHLDSPFTGIRSEAPQHVAQALYRATFDAYESIVDLCLSEQVDALLVAGDVYDGADRSLRAQQAFMRGLRRLDDAGIRSFVCHGNHDPLDGWEAELAYPDSCHRFGPEWKAVPVIEGDPDRGMVYGISYPRQVVERNLVSELGDVESGPFTIGLLHANVGDKPGHAPYAPCSLGDLAGTGIDYWALGHVHTREVMQAQHPAVVYPGNPQGRHINETGARGVYLVEVEGEDVRLDFRPMDTVRWARIEVDASEVDTEQGLHDRLSQRVQEAVDSADGRSLVVRVTLAGRTPLHSTLRRAGYLEDLRESILNEEFAGQSPFAWCERIEDETASPIDRDELLKGSDFLAEVLRISDQTRANPELRDRVVSGLTELFDHRPLQRLLEADDPREDNSNMDSLIAEAEAEVITLLLDDRDA